MEAANLKMPCFKASLRSVPPPHFRLSGTVRRPVILVSLGHDRRERRGGGGGVSVKKLPTGDC